MDIIIDKILYMNMAACALIPVVILARFLLQKAPKYIRCILWAIVAVRLVCPFSIESSFSLMPAMELSDSEEEVDDEIDEPTYQYEDEADVENDEVESDSQDEVVVEEEESDANEIPVLDDAPLSDETEDSLKSSFHIDKDIVLASIWILGMSVILIHSVISYFRLRKRVATATYCEKNIWISDDVETPFILGILKPRIYLPSSMDEEIKKYVLAHEYAHIIRKDHIWKPFGFVVALVHWFNPLVWVAYVLFSRDVEMACDEKVIKNLDVEERKAYSKALLACSTSNQHSTDCPVAFSEIDVKPRVKSVLNYKKPAFWIIIVAVIACSVVAVGFLTEPKSDEEDTVYDAENTENVSDSSNFDNKHIEKLLLEEIDEYREALPSADYVQCIDMLEHNIAEQNMLKRITDKKDIEKLMQMFNDVVIIRKAEPEETQLVGGYGAYFIIRTYNDEAFMYHIFTHDLMRWNNVFYLADIGEFDSVFSDNDLWSQFDYREFYIGWDGFDEIIGSEGKKEIVKREFTYSGNLETAFNIDEFKITIYPDGTYIYRINDYVISSNQNEETTVSGKWYTADNEIMLVENSGEEDERVNYFRFASKDIVYLKEKSDGFAGIKVYDHERFYGNAIAQ